MVDINNFTDEKSCMYKGENYLVRDNGAVLRKPKAERKPRKLDNMWTFGKVNTNTGYLEIASARIHRIVATAYHGNPPDEEYVVDHIDTNRQNNRPSNLRWVTKFENAVLNPITRKKIEYNTGVDITEFLKNPQLYRHKLKNTNFNWMRTVTEEESINCLIRFDKWMQTKPASTTEKRLDEWVFSTVSQIKNMHLPNDLTDSLTFNAKQKNWKTPTNFVCCPSEITADPIGCYLKNIGVGTAIAINRYRENHVLDFAVINNSEIITITETASGIKPFALMKITFENGFYIHESQGTFFTLEGAEKQFTLAQGLEWAGGDSIDDYC